MSTAKLDDAIIVAVDHVKDGDQSTLSGDSVLALRYAKSLTTGPVFAAATVNTPDLQTLGYCGVETVYVPADTLAPDAPASKRVFVLEEAASDVRKDHKVAAVLLSRSKRARGVAARLAVRTGGGVVVDVNSLNVVDGRLLATKRVLGGEWETTSALDCDLPIFTLALSHDMSEDMPIDETDPRVVRVSLAACESGRVRVIRSQQQSVSVHGDLKDSDVVVVGGRGVNGDFDTVYWLASILSAPVGATRVACDEGWVPRSLQIGQTGVTVAPKLYIGLGVSGAVHHTCGIQGSETIVAVCDDPDAPIFEIADFGVVGDFATVVPQAIKRLEELKSER